MRRSHLALAALVILPALVVAAAPTRWLAGASPVAHPPVAHPPVAHPPVTLDDATIVAIFDAANTADIETGTLARKRGHSKEVREFGAMLARDHAHVRQLGRDLATKLHVVPTPPADDAGGRAHAEAMRRLGALHGAAFDHAFLRHEVSFHRAVIEAVQTTLLPAIRNAEVKSLVEQVAPAFQAHMVAAQQLDDRLASAPR